LPEWKLRPSAHLEGDGLAVVGDLPALHHAADQGGEVLGFEHHDPVVDVGADLAGR
jgi:hypothetical protein